VLRLAAEGLARQEIQTRLLLSRSTVKTHFEHIYAKLGVSSRVAAVARALREGLIE
jgi:two-component system nitrate/nitrite response regulator NarL